MPIAFGGSLLSITHGSAGQSHQRRPGTRLDWAEGVQRGWGRVWGQLSAAACPLGLGLVCVTRDVSGIQADPHHSVLPQRAGIRAPQEGLDAPKCGLTLRFYQRPSSPQD